MSDFTLYMAQRLSALILAPLVVGHLALMIYAVQGGLTAGEILSRTQDSFGWGLFYATFAIAVAVHASCGLRVILREVTGLGGRMLDLAAIVVFGALLGLGLRATCAVTLA